jgi:predicted GNAT superfamily acetyltransferase
MEQVEIRELRDAEDMERVEELQRAVWTGSETDIVPAHVLLAAARHGGVVLGAFAGQELVGFVFGFLGTDEQSPRPLAMSRLKHYSHQLGVHPKWWDRGIGLRLKLAQREAVMRQGIRLMSWTYDPLQSRNAYLNVRRLGVVCNRYLRNLYGEMRDELNQGVPSDRFEVDWWLTSSRVKSRVAGRRKALDLAHFLGAGAVKVNETRLDARDLPRPLDEVQPLEGTLLLVEIPPDFNRIKAEDIGLAQAWRAHTREIFQEAFRRGYLVTDFVFLREEQFPRSYYILSHGESTLG